MLPRRFLIKTLPLLLGAGMLAWGGVAAARDSAQGGAPAQTAVASKPVTVFAAASLKNALDEVAAKWTADAGGKVVASYAASGPLAKQIEEGAPADLFISADQQWMDYADERKLLKPGTRTDLLGNTLVLIAPADSRAKIELARGADLVGLLGDGRLAIGEVRSVPAGRYAQQALGALGLWDQVENKLAQGASVRTTLALVARGEAPAGIVYGTDAKVEPGVRVVATFPAASHPPIVYPAAVIAASSNPQAQAFMAFLTSPAAATIFERYGFVLCGPAAAGQESGQGSGKTGSKGCGRPS